MRVPDLIQRAGLWPARVVWLLTPAIAANGVGDVLAVGTPTGAVVVEVALWAVWFVTLVATLIPAPASLTVCRTVGPLLVAGALITLATTGSGLNAVAIAVWGVVFCALVLLADFGDRMINGSAYGSERRMALRPQAFVLVGPLQAAWLAIAASTLLPVWAALGGRWLVAAGASVVGAAVTWAAGRVLHQLARRWIVFVPAGFVLRDPTMLVDAVLFRRHMVASLGPAHEHEPTADGSGDRTDLSGDAPGLAVEATLREPTVITLREGAHARTVETANVVFTPSLPGAMLAEARIRGLKIGAASAPSGPADTDQQAGG